MRNLKRFLALMLTVLMVAGCFALPTSAKATDVFDDVDQYTEAINALYALSVLKGTTETTFGTDDNVKRFQAALFFSRIMTGKTDDTVWKTGVNNTSFQDLGENPFINAISYVNNNGIVTGKTAVKFAPEDGITIEQLYTMGVRALGYETTAMKASLGSGLWAYIDKAITLDLDKGLEDITDYKATATRGQTAQFMYNLLFTETESGYTYAAKSFDLIQETFILAATNTEKYMIAAASETNVQIAAPGYIGLATLAADGTLGKVYYITASEFKTLAGIDADADLNDYIGYSFNIIADSTLSTVYEVATNATKTYINDTDDVQANIYNNDGGNKIVVDDVTYKAANKAATGNANIYVYTNNLWNVGVKNTANNEVLVYDWSNAATSSTNGYFYYDANGNIVSKDGKTILLYLTGNTNVGGLTINTKTYMVKDETTGTYRLPTSTDWANATYYIQGAASKYYKAVANAHDIASNNYYSELKCFDDNGDGKWDRMFYTQYKFGQFIVDGDNRYVNDANGNRVVSTNNGVTIKGESVANGTWMAYAYNSSLNELLVKKVYTATTGYVNGFSVVNGTITIDGKVYGIGNIPLSGIISRDKVFGTNSVDGWTNAMDDIIGRYVSYYKIADTVVVFANNNVSKYVVFDGIVTVTAENSISIKAYIQDSNNAQLIKVASLNGYPLSSNALTGFNTQLNYVYSTLLAMNRGTILTAAIDTNGNYHLYEIQSQSDVNVAAMTIDKTKATLGNTTILDGTGPYMVSVDMYGIVRVDGTTPEFQVNANTVYVFVQKDATTNTYGVTGTYKGFPAVDSAIFFGGETQILYRYGDNRLASFVYVIDAYGVTGSFATTQFDGVVYIDSAYTRLTNQFADTYNGTTWEYTKAIDITTGTWADVKAASTRLLAGKFYLVKNGYAIQEYTPPTVAKLDAIEYYQNLLTGNATINGVPGVKIGSIINLSGGHIETKDNAANIVSYNTPAFAASIADADKYVNAYAVTTTINGVEKTSLVLTDATVQSYKADFIKAVKALVTVDTTVAGTIDFNIAANTEFAANVTKVVFATAEKMTNGTTNDYNNAKAFDGTLGSGTKISFVATDLTAGATDRVYTATLQATYTDLDGNSELVDIATGTVTIAKA